MVLTGLSRQEVIYGRFHHPKYQIDYLETLLNQCTAVAEKCNSQKQHFAGMSGKLRFHIF